MHPAPLPAAVQSALATVEPPLVDLRRERLVVLDGAGRVQVTGQGDDHSVSPRRDEAHRLTCCAGRIVTHNHPQPGGTLSGADLYLWAKEECREVRAVTRLPDGHAVVYRVGFPARSVPRKGHTTVLDALARGMYMREFHRIGNRRGYQDGQYLSLRQVLSLYDATVRSFAKEHGLGYACEPMHDVPRAAPYKDTAARAASVLDALHELTPSAAARPMAAMTFAQALACACGGQ